jgi:hypothetical protein
MDNMGDAHEHHTHDHTHGDHSHEPHSHEPHSHEQYADRPHPEYVVLEIGGDLGALIVYTDPELHGVEIEISPTGEDGTRSHKDVLERSLGGRPAFSAVFDQIKDGSYTLWVADVARARDVRVAGGTVAELDWRSAGEPVAPLAGSSSRAGI